eukprot:5168241-Amphidinium_carterae.1
MIGLMRVHQLNLPPYPQEPLSPAPRTFFPRPGTLIPPRLSALIPGPGTGVVFALPSNKDDALFFTMLTIMTDRAGSSSARVSSMCTGSSSARVSSMRNGHQTCSHAVKASFPSDKHRTRTEL